MGGTPRVQNLLLITFASRESSSLSPPTHTHSLSQQLLISQGDDVANICPCASATFPSLASRVCVCVCEKINGWTWGFVSFFIFG